MILVGFFLFFSKSEKVNTVIFGEKTYFVEISDTNTERQRGLSFHTPLTSDEGMLFVFEKEDFHGFWMKDMLFSIDIIWIDANLRVVHIEREVSPETYPKVFRPESKSLYVLEILAGQSEINNIKIGDSLKILKK